MENKHHPMELPQVSPVESSLPDYIAMYDIPGQDNITERTYKRYLMDKKQDPEIGELAKVQDRFYEKYVKHIPLKDRARFIVAGFDNEKVDVQRMCAEMIWFAPDAERTGLIMVGFTCLDAEVRRICAEAIWGAPSRDRVKLIDTGLNDADAGVRKICAQAIERVPESKIRIELMNKLAKVIEVGLDNDDIGVQNYSMQMMRHAIAGLSAKLEGKISELIDNGLKEGDADEQKIRAGMIRYLSNDDLRKKYFDLAKSKLGDRLVEPPLYGDKEITQNHLKRRKFTKTGSETTLLGGQLMGKTIIRHFEPIEFIVWQKLFEDYQFWRDCGFDYVPIEPIQSYHLNKEGLVDVYSGVLDLSLGSWEGMTDLFSEELNADMEKIEGVLEKIGVEHGHTHSDNFCLRFFRDKDGKVDFSRKPRIYLIDFDQAASL